MSFSLPEQNLSDVKRYMAAGDLKIQATVTGEESTPVNGTLTFIDNAVDSASGTFALKGTFGKCGPQVVAWSVRECHPHGDHSEGRNRGPHRRAAIGAERPVCLRRQVGPDGGNATGDCWPGKSAPYPSFQRE